MDKYEIKDYEEFTEEQFEDEITEIDHLADDMRHDIKWTINPNDEDQMHELKKYLDSLSSALMRMTDYLPDSLMKRWHEASDSVSLAKNAEYEGDEFTVRLYDGCDFNYSDFI